VPLRYQKDFIAALVETRKATEIFAKKLTPLHDNTVKVDITPVKEEKSIL